MADAAAAAAKALIFFFVHAGTAAAWSVGGEHGIAQIPLASGVKGPPTYISLEVRLLLQQLQHQKQRQLEAAKDR